MMEVSARKYMLGNARTNLVRVGVGTLSTLIVTPFIIRGIGLESYSYVALTSFFITFSGFFDWGLSKSLVYLLNDPLVDTDRQYQYLTAQGILVGAVCLLILGVGVTAWLTGWSVLGKTLPASDPHYGVVVISSFLVLGLTVLDQFLCSVLESFFLLHRVNDGMTIKILTLNGLYLANLFLWNSLPLYVMSSVLAIGAATCYYLCIIRKQVRWEFRRPSMEAIKVLGIQTFHFFRFSILNSIYGSLPRLTILYANADLAFIGILDVVDKLSMSVINLCSSIFRPLFSLSRQAPHKVARQLGKVMALNGAMGLLYIGVIVGFNPLITGYFFSRAHVDLPFVGKVLMLYSVGSLFLLMSQPLSFYLQGEGKASRLSVVFMVNILLFLLLYALLQGGFRLNSLLSLAGCNLVISAVYLILLFVLARKTSRVRLGR